MFTNQAGILAFHTPTSTPSRQIQPAAAKPAPEKDSTVDETTPVRLDIAVSQTQSRDDRLTD